MWAEPRPGLQADAPALHVALRPSSTGGSLLYLPRALGYLGIHTPRQALSGKAWWAQNSVALSCDPLCLQSL